MTSSVTGKNSRYSHLLHFIFGFLHKPFCHSLRQAGWYPDVRATGTLKKSLGISRGKCHNQQWQGVRLMRCPGTAPALMIDLEKKCDSMKRSRFY
jgi:hypothetical protein